MPYMHIYKGADGFWHRAVGAPAACEAPRTQEHLRIGGGRESGNDTDPPKAEMCRTCFHFLFRDR